MMLSFNIKAWYGILIVSGDGLIHEVSVGPIYLGFTSYVIVKIKKKLID